MSLPLVWLCVGSEHKRFVAKEPSLGNQAQVHSCAASLTFYPQPRWNTTADRFTLSCCPLYLPVYSNSVSNICSPFISFKMASSFLKSAYVILAEDNKHVVSVNHAAVDSDKFLWPFNWNIKFLSFIFLLSLLQGGNFSLMLACIVLIRCYKLHCSKT